MILLQSRYISKVESTEDIIWGYGNKKGDSDILDEISENVTLVQLMETLVNLNHSISIVGYCMFESRYEKALCLTKESLDLVLSLSVREEQVETF